MLRFDVGDFICLDKTQKCACGRNSGLIAEAIEGRFTNSTLTCDGRLVTLRTLDNALSALEGLDEYKLEQTSHGVYVLYTASRRREKNTLEKEAEKIIRTLYGKKADITIVHKEFLAPEDSGKYSLAKTLFPLDINDYLDIH